MSAATSSKGVHSLPKADRPVREEAPRSPSRARQLWDAQDAGSEGVARQTPALPSALHAHQRILAQSRRALLRRDHDQVVCKMDASTSDKDEASAGPTRALQISALIAWSSESTVVTASQPKGASRGR